MVTADARRLLARAAHNGLRDGWSSFATSLVFFPRIVARVAYKIIMEALIETAVQITKPRKSDDSDPKLPTRFIADAGAGSTVGSIPAASFIPFGAVANALGSVVFQNDEIASINIEVSARFENPSNYSGTISERPSDARVTAKIALVEASARCNAIQFGLRRELTQSSPPTNTLWQELDALHQLLAAVAFLKIADPPPSPRLLPPPDQNTKTTN